MQFYGKFHYFMIIIILGPKFRLNFCPTAKVAHCKTRLSPVLQENTTAVN